ncbi:hypothetical protein ACS0TY_005723 [Phlomoides rotata]
MDLRQSLTDESGNSVSFSITSIISSLVSAILEWILMFMIFVDSSFAYLVTRFAHHSQLQIPCLLCSRLDHFLGNEREGFYWDLICHDHKLKISSLVICQLHNNLVDIHQILLVVGKLGAHEPDENIDSRKCSCCNEQWVSRISIQNLITKESSRLGQLQDKDTDPLPHVEYSQIKVTSDTESDGLFSDNESHSAFIRASGQDSAAKYDFTESQITSLADGPPSEKLIIHLASPIKISLSESEDHTYLNLNVESEAPVQHELERQQADHNDDVSKPLELASSCGVHPSPNANKTNDMSTPELEKEVLVECEEASNLGRNSAGISELWKEVNMESQETFLAKDSKSYRTDTSSQMTESLDLGDAYKIALGTRGRQLSGRLLEQQRSMSESTRASEDLKLLLSQMSFARGIDLSNDMSPRVSASNENSGAIGMQIFQRRISLERNESNLSLDGSNVSEIEGESELDRLKRQVEHDKKILVSLYKELEEERNASAIAANQAMAMITRLQEEKAAFHMEALQCVRMMEEQAEYDSEALQKANEMLTEKEKQIQDFEFELELYRNQCGDVPPSNEPRPESESDELKDIVKKIDVEIKRSDGDDSVGVSLHQFEDEKGYILECLKKLEKKLSIFIIDGPNSTDEVFEASSSDQDISEENGRTEKSHLQSNDFSIAALKREFSVMRKRMGALEAEQVVIECSINALKKGSEGFEFIREIAFRLQELHSAHIVKETKS